MMAEEEFVRLGVFAPRPGETDIDTTLPAMKTFKTSLTVGKMKEMVMMVVGTEPQYQKLALMKEDGTVVAELEDDNALLSTLPIESDMLLRVIDVDPNQTVAGLEDLSQVEKVRLTDEEYDKREGTYRKWRQENPDYKLPFQPGPRPGGAYEEDPVEISKALGARCRVGGDKLGHVRFCARTMFASGYWVGVDLDEAAGKNDGTVKGTRYFKCEPDHGVFVRADKIELLDDEM